MLLERRLLELRDQARCQEELLQRRASSDEQREVLALLCKVHELEMEKTEVQWHALLRDGVIRQKNLVVQRFEQHRHLCDEIIQQQRQVMDGELSATPAAITLAVCETEGFPVRALQITDCQCLRACRSCTTCTPESWTTGSWSEPSPWRE